MAKQGTKSASKQVATSDALEPFERVVESALENFNQPESLGNQSPLAAPYYISQIAHLYSEKIETPLERGRNLQRLLRDAAKHLDEDSQKLLSLRYFSGNHQLNDHGIALELGLKNRTYYRKRIRAIQDLAQALSRTVMPPLRLEWPQSRELSGRNDMVQTLLATLQAGQSVSLLGPGGIGKTTLGAAIAVAWNAYDSHGIAGITGVRATQQQKDVFWFTIRPGLTDRLTSLLFNLGYWLHLHGASVVWQQLVADKGTLQVELILGLLRNEFIKARHNHLLICLDEVDLLQPDELGDHAQIIHVIEELCSLTPVLLVGQRMVVDTGKYILLTGLTLNASNELLTNAQCALEDSALKKVYEFTRGNPSLLILFSVLYRLIGNVAKVLEDLGSIPSVEVIFRRIWRHLTPEQQILLMRLSVFRSAVPKDTWNKPDSTSNETLNTLISYQLVHQTQQSTVSVMPHIRRILYDQIAPDSRVNFHVLAAKTYEDRGEYTDAMYHFCEAGQADQALRVWFVHATHEIERGQGANALELLRSINPASLTSGKERDALRLARARLLRLSGRNDEAELELKQNQGSSLYFRAAMQIVLADTYDAQEKFDLALAQYTATIETYLGMPELQKATVHRKLSGIYRVILADLPKAREQALLAVIDSETTYGSIEERSGNYSEAERHYHSALSLTDQIPGQLFEKSHVYSHLGSLMNRLGNYPASIEYLEKAIACHAAMGDIATPLNDRISLSATYILSGQYTQAIEQAEIGLPVAESLNNTYFIAGLSSNAGEAYCYLDQLAQAETYAERSLSTEDDGWSPYALAVLGMVRHKQKRLDEAVQYFQMSIKAAQDVKDKYAEGDAYFALGKVHVTNNQHKQARIELEHALQNYSDLGRLKQIADVEAVLISLA